MGAIWGGPHHTAGGRRRQDHLAAAPRADQQCAASVITVRNLVTDVRGQPVRNTAPHPRLPDHDGSATDGGAPRSWHHRGAIAVHDEEFSAPHVAGHVIIHRYMNHDADRSHW